MLNLWQINLNHQIYYLKATGILLFFYKTCSVVPRNTSITSKWMICVKSSEKVNLLNNYFVQQTSLDERFATISAMVNIIGSSLTNRNFTLFEVKSVLESLQLGKSSGPDGI